MWINDLTSSREKNKKCSNSADNRKYAQLTMQHNPPLAHRTHRLTYISSAVAAETALRCCSHKAEIHYR